MTPPTVQDHNDLEELLLLIIEELRKSDLVIPPLPHVAGQIFLLLNDPNANAGSLETLLQQDQSLASQVMRIANSPAYLPREPIESLQQAIAWVGLNLVASTVLSVSTQSGVFNVKGYETEVKGLWQHSLAVGLYGKAIAGQMGLSAENAFLCGLLHALGKPFVVHTVNNYRKEAETLLPWSVMLTVLKESYIAVGTTLAVAWQLPQAVQEAILLHRDHDYHLGTSPMKGAPITCLAIHLAEYLYDPSISKEGTLRALPVVQALQVSENNMNALLEMQDTIRASVKTMVL